MQLLAHVFYGKRAVYYLCKVYTDQLESGDDYSKLNTTIGIHFLDFKYFDDDRAVRQFVFKDVDTGETSEKLDCVRLYFVELPKLDKAWPNVRTALDRWASFLNRAGELNRASMPAEMNAEPAIVKALVELERIGMDPDEREIYEGEVKALMVDQIQIRSAEERGELRGRQQTLVDGVLRILGRRLGPAPQSLAGRINGMTTVDLDDLLIDAITIGSYADVEAWIAGRAAL